MLSMIRENKAMAPSLRMVYPHKMAFVNALLAGETSLAMVEPSPEVSEIQDELGIAYRQTPRCPLWAVRVSQAFSIDTNRTWQEEYLKRDWRVIPLNAADCKEQLVEALDGTRNALPGALREFVNMRALADKVKEQPCLFPFVLVLTREAPAQEHPRIRAFVQGRINHGTPTGTPSVLILRGERGVCK